MHVVVSYVITLILCGLVINLHEVESLRYSPVLAFKVSIPHGNRRLVWKPTVGSNIPVMLSGKFLTTASSKNILGQAMYSTYRNPFKLATLTSHDPSSSSSQTDAASGRAPYESHAFLLPLLGRCSLTLG
jgi:hypothetical protein